MTLSRSEQILAAFEAAAAGTPGLGNRIYRDREQAIARNELHALVIEPGGETDEILTTTETITTQLVINADLFIQGAPLSTVADPIRVALHNRIMTNTTLLALVISIYPRSRDWEPEVRDLGAVRIRYTATYRNNLIDLTLP